MSIVVVSDSHLSPRTPEATTNWTAVVDHVAEARPAFVVHVGDICADGPGHPEDLAFARTQLDRLDRLDVEWRAVPGNHDIGDSDTTEKSVSVESLASYRAVLGADHWAVTLDGWTLIGVNSQLIGSGLDAEAEQWTWLEERLATAGPVALFTHKPLGPVDAEERRQSPPSRFVRSDPAARLRAPAVKVVVTGHVHQYRHLHGPAESVWAPTTWATLPDRIQPPIGTKVVGLLELELGSTVRHRVVRPAGLRQLEIGRDVRNPY